MAVKIAIIGGGSAYAPGVINAFIQKSDVFTGGELALMDIAEKELEIVATLAKRLVDFNGVPLKITHTLNQQEAIDGADYVLSTFRQGGFEARHLDETIPLEFDVIGQETIGPGGFFFAMRTIPIIKMILADINKYAPGAVLVNYTNPTQIVAEAVTHFSNVPCISICDQTKADKENILSALRITNADVELESIGLNHATWSTKFTIDGEDGVEIMNQNLEKVLAHDDIDSRVKRQFLLTSIFNRVPNSYMQYYYFKDETLLEAKNAKKTRAQIIMDELPSYYRHFQEQITAEVPNLTHVRGGSIFGDMAVEVISELYRKKGNIHTLNVPNHGALPDFPTDRIVEVPAQLEEKTATPIKQEKFPPHILGLLQMLGNYQYLAATSIWNKDYREMEKALASNPLVLSISKAQKMIKKIVPLQKPWLVE